MALIHCDFYSEVLGMYTSICAILPQPRFTVDRKRGSGVDLKYPVLYLLHGILDDHTTWQRKSSIERYVEPLGLAVIMPAVHRSFYTDMVHGNKYWTYVSEELPSLIQSLFYISPEREDNFVAGLSMGGYGAFKLALRHPSRYAAAASLSGGLDIVNIALGGVDEAWHTEMEAVFGNVRQISGSENDLFQLAKAISTHKEDCPFLYQCCGVEDFIYQDNLRFRDNALSLNLPLTYEEGPGYHEWKYWDKQIQRVLEWLPIRPPKIEILSPPYVVIP